MLILNRSPGDRILVGDDIVVVITEIKGSHVKIGIEAPDAMPIVRGELKNNADTESEERTEALSPAEFSTGGG